MATGLYRGSIPLEEFALKVMRVATEHGVRRPYYGAVNASVCSYSFEISG
ncbi:MAG TPA: hypothetical protein VFE51_28260 [Verrucomicrobiae bacterium]|nr:hypothetical protein [Verrucomicrobiae bacterium]